MRICKMIISRTPYRISFFGGTTDYPQWYNEFGGSVISTTINKYSFLVVRKLPTLFDYKYRIRYYEVQEADSIDEIQIPVIRECLRYCNIDFPIDITHHGDLPSRTGIGSSSSFTVSLLHALYALQNQQRTKRQLADDALYIEQQILNQYVGSQDQVAASFGGFNRIDFGGHRNFLVNPLTLDKKTHDELDDSVQIFYTGDCRESNDLSKSIVETIPQKHRYLHAMNDLTNQAQDILFSNNQDKIKQFGTLLQEEWNLKKQIQPNASNEKIDNIIDQAIQNGAHGGKLLGAGEGGFLMFLTNSAQKKQVEQAIGLTAVPIRFDYCGSQLIYYDRQDTLTD